MKRIFSHLFVLIFVVSMFGVFSNISLAKVSIENELNYNEYSTLLREMVKKYSGNDNIPFETTSNNISETNRIIVKTNSNEPLGNTCNAIEKIEGYNCWHILQYEDNTSATFAFSFYYSEPYVIYVEFDEFIDISNTFSLGEDAVSYTSTPLSWGCTATGSTEASNLISLSDIVLNNVVVGVIDCGVDNTHELLNDRVLPSDNSYDNTDAGIPFMVGHGTHVAGIIANNTLPNVKIKSFNFYTNPTFATVASAISAAVAYPVNVINICLNSINSNQSESINSEINNAYLKGIVVVNSAGNGGNNASSYVLTNVDDKIIVVAATNKSSSPASSSNYGSCVDIAAPGEEIYSTYLNGKYKKMTGTSQAAPFVSAAVAMLKSIDSTLSPSDIQSMIKSTAYIPANWPKKQNENDNTTKTYGIGVVNFINLIKYKSTPSPLLIYVQSDEKLSITLPVDAEPGTIIYYTIDSSFPNPDTATLYTEPISVLNPEIKTVTAISYHDGMIISYPSKYIVRMSKITTIQYKGTDKLTVPNSITNLTWKSNNPNIVSVDSAGYATGLKRGTATVVGVNNNHQTVTYEVIVDFVWWQWLIVIFLFGWAWY